MLNYHPCADDLHLIL